MFVFATILMSCIYAIPAVIAFVVRGVAASNARRQIKLAGQTRTSQSSDDVSVAFLHANGIDDVPVEKGEDYFTSSFDKKKNVVAISPDAYKCVDAYSIARALNACSQVLVNRNEPEKPATYARVDTIATWCFWIAFCALSFAIMGASFVSACLGYAALLPVWLNALAQVNFLKNSHKPVEKFLKDSGVFKSEEIKPILCALAAIRVNR